MELQIDPAADQAILSALRSGDVRQAARLMVQYHGLAVFQVCLRAVGDQEQAEDLTQASFARAFALIQGFRGGLSTRQWLEGIAQQCCAQAGTTAGEEGEARPVSDSLRRRLEVLASAL